MINKRLTEGFKHNITPLRNAGYITPKEHHRVATKIQRIKKTDRIDQITQITRMLIDRKIKFDGGWIPLIKLTSLPDVEETLEAFEDIRRGNLDSITRVSFLPGDIAEACVTHLTEIPEFAELSFPQAELISANAARTLAHFPGALCFDNIHYVQKRLIPLLAPQSGQLNLPNLQKISDTDCKALAAYPRNGVDLSSASEISPQGAETIMDGATRHYWEIVLLGTAVMTDTLAEKCRDYPGDLYLPQLDYSPLTYAQKQILAESKTMIAIGPHIKDSNYLFTRERSNWN